MTTSYKSNIFSLHCVLTPVPLTKASFYATPRYNMNSSTALPMWHSTVLDGMRLRSLVVKWEFTNGATDHEHVMCGPVFFEMLRSDF
jgi:hypothetical protein